MFLGVNMQLMYMKPAQSNIAGDEFWWRFHRSVVVSVEREAQES